MAIVNINLLSQQQFRSRRELEGTTILWIVVGSILGLQLVIAAFLYTTIGIRTAQKNNIASTQTKYIDQAKALNDFKYDIYPGLNLATQLNQYYNQAGALNSLIEKHKYFSLYVTEMVINTPPTISYDSFNTDGADNLLVVGKADTYPDVSKLVESFKNLSFAKQVSLTSAKQDKDPGAPKGISFTMTITLKPASELKNPRRTSASPAPRPSAVPSASATPRPSGSATPGTNNQTIPGAPR